MAKVVSTLFIAADGVAEIDPDWHFPYFDETMGRAVGEDYDTSDVLLLGRDTYDSFAGALPDREAAGGDDAPSPAAGRHTQGGRLAAALEFSWRNSELIDGDLSRPPAHSRLIPTSRASYPGSITWCSSCSPQAWSTSCACWCTRWPHARVAGSSTTATRRTT